MDSACRDEPWKRTCYLCCLGLARDIAAARGLRLGGGPDVLLVAVETWPPLAASLSDRGIDLIDLCAGGG